MSFYSMHSAHACVMSHLRSQVLKNFKVSRDTFIDTYILKCVLSVIPLMTLVTYSASGGWLDHNVGDHSLRMCGLLL